ncbi:MAG: response regulator transcription factor [Desulfobacterales bacterium]
MAEQLTPEVIVMDVAMPGMDGIEAITLISQSQPDVRIFALSMHDNQLTRNRMHAAGATAYINKHALPGELIKAIRRFL